MVLAFILLLPVAILKQCLFSFRTVLYLAGPFYTAPNQQAAVAHVSQWKSEDTNFEGLRVAVDEGDGRAGWLMNRMSLHEPIVIFNVESVSFRINASGCDIYRIV